MYSPLQSLENSITQNMEQLFADETDEAEWSKDSAYEAYHTDIVNESPCCSVLAKNSCGSDDTENESSDQTVEQQEQMTLEELSWFIDDRPTTLWEGVLGCAALAARGYRDVATLFRSELSLGDGGYASADGASTGGLCGHRTDGGNFVSECPCCSVLAKNSCGSDNTENESSDQTVEQEEQITLEELSWFIDDRPTTLWEGVLGCAALAARGYRDVATLFRSAPDPSSDVRNRSTLDNDTADSIENLTTTAPTDEDKKFK